MNKIRELCRLISTAGTCGRWPFGGIAFSIFGALFIYMLQGFFKLEKSILLGVVVGVTILLAIIMQIAMMASSKEFFDKRMIVIDKIIGIFCALLFVPAKAKVILFGFVLFHLISFGQQFVQFRGYAARLSELPGVLGIISDDLTAGILVNGFLHLMIWIVH